MDIFIRTDFKEQVFTEEYYAGPMRKEHELSRTFCNLMFRYVMQAGPPELDQIGTLTNIDITPIYDMENYGWDSDEEKASDLCEIENENQKEKLIEADVKLKEKLKEKLKGNIGIVYKTVNELIDKLSVFEELPFKLDCYGRDTLRYEHYFTSFNEEKTERHRENNFGQDLRNFKRFLEYAESKGATTVYFIYG